MTFRLFSLFDKNLSDKGEEELYNSLNEIREWSNSKDWLIQHSGETNLYPDELKLSTIYQRGLSELLFRAVKGTFPIEIFSEQMLIIIGGVFRVMLNESLSRVDSEEKRQELEKWVKFGYLSESRDSRKDLLTKNLGRIKRGVKKKKD